MNRFKKQKEPSYYGWDRKIYDVILNSNNWILCLYNGNVNE